MADSDRDLNIILQNCSIDQSGDPAFRAQRVAQVGGHDAMLALRAQMAREQGATATNMRGALGDTIAPTQV